MNLLEALERSMVNRFADRHILMPAVQPMTATIESNRYATVKTHGGKIRTVSVIEELTQGSPPGNAGDTYSMVAVMGIDFLSRVRCDIQWTLRTWNGGTLLVIESGGIRIADDRIAVTRDSFDPEDITGRVWTANQYNLPASDRIEALTSMLFVPDRRSVSLYDGPARIIRTRKPAHLI